jgi:methylated-DNA-[protein]-cysteine S-methyltransferase
VSVVRHRYAVAGWGVGEVVVADGVVVAHELPEPSVPLDRAARQASSRLVERLVRRVCTHLAGTRTAYDDIPLDLSWCTGFQRELASAIREVPWGEIVSYGELAALAGRPGAARAAGTFCARNRFALVFPCHRVVSSTHIGGYGSAGIGLKRRLLALEGIEL